MINFKEVTAVQLPEGIARALAIGGIQVWNGEKWDLEWEYDGSLPPTSVWYKENLSISTNEKAIQFYSASSDGYCRIMTQNGIIPESDACVFEMEIKVVSIGTRGNIDGSIATMPNYGTGFKIYKSASGAQIGVGSGSDIQYYPVTLNAWHTIRLKVDEKNGTSGIYLDGVLLRKYVGSNVPAYTVAGVSASGAAECYIRAMRYRKIE